MFDCVTDAPAEQTILMVVSNNIPYIDQEKSKTKHGQETHHLLKKRILFTIPSSFQKYITNYTILLNQPLEKINSH
jgi:hypothetical protein